MDEMLIVFGNGEETKSTTRAHIGDLQAIVCNDDQLTDDLVAVHPILDAGYYICFSSWGGVIDKPGSEHFIPILRNDKKWLVDLEELKNIKTKRKAIYCNTVSVTSRALRLHERMGHPATEAMCNAIDSGAWQNSNLTVDQVRRAMNQNICLTCILAKKNKPKSKSSSKDTLLGLQVGELLSADIIGKIQPPTRDGCVYFYLFVDKRSGYMNAYTARTKDGFVTALANVIDFYEQNGHKIKSFRSDSEQIMKWGSVKELLEKRSIKPQYSLPYAHYQNLAERYVQTIVKAVSVMIHGQSFLKANLWDYALFFVINCQNLTPNSKTGKNTPSQLVTGKNYLDIEQENLFSFGQLIIV
jgi:hypothetical protein